MHPVIRIICFLILGGFVALGGVAELLTAIPLVILLYVLRGLADLPAGWRMLRRLRWLLFSVFLVYLLFTPGVPLSDAGSFWLPAREGVIQGGLRIAVLAILVLSVNLLLRATAQDELLGALLWLLRPLRAVGLPHEQLAVRISLTLRIVTEVRLLQSLAPNPQVDTKNLSWTRQLSRRIQGFGRKAADLFEEVLSRAEQAPLPAIDIAETTVPPAQWVIPIVLGMLFFVAGHLD